MDHIAEADYDVLHIATPGPLGLAAKVDSIVREFYQRCGVMMVTSKDTAGSLVERGYRLKNGVDTALFSPEKRVEALRQALGSGKPCCSTSDVSLARRAWIPSQRHITRRIGMTFTGFLEGEELARIYASADPFVFPSETDTLGRIVTEARASGLSAVVFGVSGHRETLRGGETGFHNEAGNMAQFMERTMWLVDRPAVRAEMGKAAADHASDLDWANVDTDMMAIFRECHRDSVENCSLTVAN